jgi:hypothetical protein
VTVEERQHQNSIENMTLQQIKDEIENVIVQLPDTEQSGYYLDIYNTEIKGKRKSDHIHFLKQLKDTVMDTQIEEN